MKADARLKQLATVIVQKEKKSPDSALADLGFPGDGGGGDEGPGYGGPPGDRGGLPDD